MKEKTLSDKLNNYLNDEDVMKVAHSAAASFSGVLSKDEIYTCILNAIWKASEKYLENGPDGDGRTTKFTSYLHNGVVFECLTQRKFNANRASVSLNRHNPSFLCGNDETASIDMLDEISRKCDDPVLVYDRFYKNMSIKELAEIRGVTGEAIRIRLKKNLKKLKKSLSSSV